MNNLELFERVTNTIMPVLLGLLPVVGTVLVAHINSRLKQTAEGASSEAVQEDKKTNTGSQSLDTHGILVSVQHSCVVMLHELDHIKKELWLLRNSLYDRNERS